MTQFILIVDTREKAEATLAEPAALIAAIKH
jgi:hypothetical protein